MEWEIGNRTNLLLLLAAVLALGLALYAQLCRRAAAKRFAAAESLAGLGWRSGSWRLWFAPWLSAAGLALLALALADIRYGKSWREVPQKGIEVMFLLDVSRSMLAEDVAPNRLARAKQQIRDLIDEMVGDRIGLVVFAGDAKQVVPLTSHYDDFVQTLDTVNPVSVLRGGSKLGEAIRVGSEGFMEKTNDHKAMVIFTDGEDQESDPLEAARTAFEEQGIRIFAIGLGDLEQGARIPAGGQRSEPTPIYVQHEGQTVWSKLNGQILSEIATSTGGAYIPAGTKRVDMQGVYQGYIASVEQTEFQTARINAFTPRFQWFALPALLCFVAEFLLTNRVRHSVRAVMILCCGCWLGGFASPAYAQAPNPAAKSNPAPESNPASQNSLPAAGQFVPQPVQQINAANELLRQEKVAEAIAAYGAVDPPKRLRPTWLYNQGVAHYRQQNYALAAEAFRESAGSADRQLAAQSRYNLGNSLYAQALAAVEAAEKTAAEELLSEAIEHYRGALRGDRELVDARANIELAARLLQQLKDEQADQQQQEQQQQQQQDQDQEQEQEPSSEQQDQQSQAGNESSPAENERSQSNDDGSQSGDERSQSEDESEQSGSEEGSQAEDQADSSAGNQAGGEEGDEPEETTAAADEAGQPPSTDGELSAANADASSADPSDDRQGKPVTGMMTREEAMKMLQSVRDRDLLRRLLKEQRERARRVPVQRDW